MTDETEKPRHDGEMQCDICNKMGPHGHEKHLRMIRRLRAQLAEAREGTIEECAKLALMERDRLRSLSFQTESPDEDLMAKGGAVIADRLEQRIRALSPTPNQENNKS